jgi:hypothetical protein
MYAIHPAGDDITTICCELYVHKYIATLRFYTHDHNESVEKGLGYIIKTIMVHRYSAMMLSKHMYYFAGMCVMSR